ncbi:guanylate kinase [Patescibacteria group bacterium]|nr:guanylate kinase [Patescibacteria group bacterium]
MNTQNKQALLVIISSPAGGGKDSAIRRLLKILPNSAKLVTTTSRAKRPRDIEGGDHFFISKEEFEKQLQQGQFLEYNITDNKYYGICKNYFKKLQDNNDIILAPIDVDGKKHFDDLRIPHLSIFLLPNNMDTLRERARRRGGMTEEMIENRIRLGYEEIERAKDYDYKLVNHDGKLDETVDNIAKIIKERLVGKGNIDKKADLS